MEGDRAVEGGVPDLRSDFAGGAQADGEGSGHCAGSEAPLLAAAAHLRLEAHAGAAADVEGADALGAVEFVARDAHEVDVEVVDADGYLADGLRGVGVQEDLHACTRVVKMAGACRAVACAWCSETPCGARDSRPTDSIKSVVQGTFQG